LDPEPPGRWSVPSASAGAGWKASFSARRTSPKGPNLNVV
jgi:hypothetical protein